MYASINPLAIDQTEDCATAAYDRRKPVGSNGASVSKLDVAQALLPCEQIAHGVPIPASPAWTPLQLARRETC
jgi:hypothetical protein